MRHHSACFILQVVKSKFLAHTIINNLLKKALAGLKVSDPNDQKVLKVHNQIEKVNEIGKKIREIKKYKIINFMDSVKIVDIDKLS